MKTKAKGLESLSQTFGLKIANEKKFVIISGPTAVGKTDFAEYLVGNLKIKAEIINVDMGQFYQPLSIGTAKPRCTNNCHLFDIIKEPIDFTVFDFRKLVLKSLKDCWSRDVLPILVGGSGFYIKALFYSPTKLNGEHADQDQIYNRIKNKTNEELFLELKDVDYERAKKIHPNDRYRIERALYLWYKMGIKPTKLIPKFDPIGSALFYFLNKDRKELRDRISRRVKIMLNSGWLNEVENLKEAWKEFLLRKKLIGYPEIIEFCSSDERDMGRLIQKIQQKTFLYAKRQEVFWKSLFKQLKESDSDNSFIKDMREIKLMDDDFEYLKNVIENKICES